MGAVKERIATLYDTDFHAWTQQQADLLRRGESGIETEAIPNEPQFT